MAYAKRGGRPVTTTIDGLRKDVTALRRDLTEIKAEIVDLRSKNRQLEQRVVKVEVGVGAAGSGEMPPNVERQDTREAYRGEGGT